MNRYQKALKDLRVCREYLQLIVHTSRCLGCRMTSCQTLRILLDHLQQCQNGSQCADYSQCYRVRVAILHACNCNFEHCKLCKGIINNATVDILPVLTSTVRDANPARICEMLGLSPVELFDFNRREEYIEIIEIDDDDDDEDCTPLSTVEAVSSSSQKRLHERSEEDDDPPPKK